jgi:hypothetical protein
MSNQDKAPNGRSFDAEATGLLQPPNDVKGFEDGGISETTLDDQRLT